MSPPLVSVLMTVFDGARYLAEAIDSALAQDHAALEVVVVDDGSTDDSAAVAAAYGPPVRCLREPHRGMGPARNVAVASAAGDLVTFLDADDRLPAGSIACRLARFEDDRSLDVVFGHQREFVSDDLEHDERVRMRPPIASAPSRLPSGALVRRAALARVGPFSDTLTRGSSVDWSSRALDAGLRTCTVPDVVYERRLHATNNGRTDPGERDYLLVVKAALDRRRAGGDAP